MSQRHSPPLEPSVSGLRNDLEYRTVIVSTAGIRRAV
jgi:hypothetical protein